MNFEYGSRARIGLIIPSVNVAVEAQLPRLAPPGVSFHVARLRLTSSDPAQFQAMLDGLESAAASLADAEPTALVFHCTAVTTMRPGIDAEIIARLTAATGLPSTATGRAALEALRRLEARRIVLITPYPKHVNDKEIAFLRDAGIEVLADHFMDVDSGAGMLAITPEQWVAIGEANRHAEADAYFLSCAATRALESVGRLEAVLGRPVINSNQLAFWHGLRTAGVADRVPGFGALLERF